jgi:hypothetical protein
MKNMPAKITRRALATGVVAVPAALAQGQPQAAPPKEDPAQLLEAQRAQVQRNLEQIRGFKLPQSSEPAFRFEA